MQQGKIVDARPVFLKNIIRSVVKSIISVINVKQINAKAGKIYTNVVLEHKHMHTFI